MFSRITKRFQRVCYQTICHAGLKAKRASRIQILKYASSDLSGIKFPVLGTYPPCASSLNLLFLVPQFPRFPCAIAISFKIRPATIAPIMSINNNHYGFMGSHWILMAINLFYRGFYWPYAYYYQRKSIFILLHNEKGWVEKWKENYSFVICVDKFHQLSYAVASGWWSSRSDGALSKFTFSDSIYSDLFLIMAFPDRCLECYGPFVNVRENWTLFSHQKDTEPIKQWGWLVSDNGRKKLS